jgi:hypothetical protein
MKIIRKIKIIVLSELLFRANSESKHSKFYAIKNQILAEFGKPIGRDLQTIPGKECFHCCGTGYCSRSWCDCAEAGLCYCSKVEDRNEGHYHDPADEDRCQRCYGDGWYKRPQNNVLVKIQLGKYTFHQPTERLSDEEVEKYVYDSKIHSYIKHSPKKYGKFALSVLAWIYDREFYRHSLDEVPF